MVKTLRSMQGKTGYRSDLVELQLLLAHTATLQGLSACVVGRFRYGPLNTAITTRLFELR